MTVIDGTGFLPCTVFSNASTETGEPMLVEGMSSIPPSLSTVTINGNYLQSNNAASALAKPNLVTVVKVGSPPAWGEDARSLTSFQTFPRSHSHTTSTSEPISDLNLNPLSADTPNRDAFSILTVMIPLAAGDRRFGFSVIGGIDERFAPKIEAINAGSPADRANIEVGDEILEVNGRSIEKGTHTEVISHIHQCIRSRCICLKLRRTKSKEHRPSSQLGTTSTPNGNHLPAPLLLPGSPTLKENGNRVFDDPIPNVVDAPPPLGFASDDPPLLINQSSSQPLLPRAHSLLSGSVVQHNIQHSIDDNSAVPLTPLPNLEVSSSVSSVPAGLSNGNTHTKPVPPPLAIPVPSPRRASEKLLNRPMPSKIEVPQSPLFKNVSLEQLPRSPLATTFSSPPQSPLFKDAPIGSQLVPLSLPPRPTLDLQSGTHREMAVDVPDAFIPMAKQAPRYPPMKPSIDTLSRNTEVPKMDKTRALRNGGSGQTPQEQQMEMFLRSSIRQSKKLRELEKSPAPVQSKGVVNNAFEPEHSPTVHPPIELQPTVDVTKLYDVSALQTALSRVIDYVGNDGGAFDDGYDLEKVMQLLDAEEFQSCLAITNIIKQILCSQAAPSAPVRSDAKELCEEISQSPLIQDSAVGQELLAILNDANISQLLECHDRISKVFGAPKGAPANSVSSPDATLVPSGQPNSAQSRRIVNPPPELGSFLDEGENARIIQIDKTSDPLGATVRNEGESIIVGRIVKGGAAEKSGLLHEGDEIVAVNGVEMRGKTVAQVSDELANMHGKLTFVIIPSDRYSAPEIQQNQTPVMHIKAHFDYDPEDDMYIPCRELGIGFQKGDILHVISMDDPNWWQAYKDGEDETTLAGLIPSKSFQLRREAIRLQLMNHGEEERGGSQRGKRLLCAPTIAKKSHSMKSSRKNSKGKMYNSATQVTQDEEPLLYEEVGLYYPRANKKRPVVLIGPSNIGKHELRERLMEDAARFAAAIPHTSRPRKDSEADGADYHFISRAQFENDILNGRFVEHGEYEKNYYGTSLQAIRAIVHSGQICVLNLHPESLKILKRSDLKPYVIFIAPPSLEKLRQNRVKVGASVKTEELKEIIEKARDIEENYGAYFDSVIINDDQERAYRELQKEIAFIEREPQWVPKHWLDYE